MQINLIYDSSTSSAPAGFFAAMNCAAQYLDSLITNNITVNIDVGWGEVAGQSLGGSLGEGGPEGNIISYSQLKADLLANSNSAADATAYANLPASDPSNGAGIFVSYAEEKAWGLLSATGSEVDGFVGFSNTGAWNFSTTNQAVAGQYGFLGDALHELTHALGRDSGLNPGSPMTVMDLFQYASPGVIQTQASGASYFSINGGATNLGAFDTTSDAGDWTSATPNDSFDAYSTPGQAFTISPTDITLMNVLGFGVNGSMLGGTGGVTVITNLPTAEDHLVYLLYQAAYNRMPDYAGLEYWAGQADANQLTALQLADQFLAAPEFTAAFGANPTNNAFVTELYTNVLGRTPDAAGLAYWEAQAAAGVPRDQLLVDFATSTENLALTAPHTINGLWVS